MESALIAKVSAQGVDKATKQLDKFADSAENAESGVGGLVNETKEASNKLPKFGSAANDSAKKIKAMERETKKAEQKLRLLAVQAKKAARQLKESEQAAKKLKEQEKLLSDQTQSNVSDFKKLATSAAVVVTSVLAVTAGVTAYSNAITTASRETDTFARQANLTTEEFRSMSFAASSVGVSADQLSAMLEEISRKAAEFAKLGTGTFDDYVKVMGITQEEGVKVAESIGKMSGREGLLLLTTNMEAAGVSTKEMGFVLDSIGSDMDRLIPLLADGGSEADRLEDKFSKLGKSINKDDIKIYEDFTQNAGLATGSLKVLLTEGLTPVVAGFSDAALEATKFFNVFIDRNREAKKLAEETLKINELLGIKEEVTDRDRLANITRRASAEEKAGEEANELLLENIQLQKIINTEFEKRSGTAGMFSGTLRAQHEERREEARIELADNNKRIEQLQKESQIAQKIVDIRSNVNTSDAVDSPTPSEVVAPSEGGDKRINFLTVQAEKELELKRKKDEKEKEIDDKKFARETDAAQARVTALQAANDTELESIQRQSEAKFQQAALDYENDLISYESYLASKAEITKKREDEIEVINEKKKDKKEKTEKDERNAVRSTLNQSVNDLEQSLGKKNTLYKAALAAQKADSIVSTTIKTYESATSAYAALAPIPIVGPALGIAAAGLAVTAGLANVAAISGAREQGGQTFSGQTILAGERGAELITTESNARVINAKDTANIMNGGNGGNVVNLTVIDQSTGNKEFTQETTNGETILLIRDIVSSDFQNPNSQITRGAVAGLDTSVRR